LISVVGEKSCRFGHLSFSEANTHLTSQRWLLLFNRLKFKLI